MFCARKESLLRATAKYPVYRDATQPKFIRFNAPCQGSNDESRDFISYLTAYSFYPRQVEMMVKAGLRKPLNDLMWARRKNAEIMDWNEPNIRKAFRLDKREIREFLADCKEIDCLPIYRKLKEAGLTLDFGTLHQIYRYYGAIWMKRCAEYMIRYSLTWARLGNYLDREQRATPYAHTVIMEEWCDYIRAAEELGLDLRNDVYLLPRDLQRRHDERTAAIAAVRAVEEEKKREAAREKERARYESLTKRYAFSDERWMIRPPVSAAEIVDEGRTLLHCVGGYAERYVNGSVVIRPVRKPVKRRVESCKFRKSKRREGRTFSVCFCSGKRGYENA